MELKLTEDNVDKINDFIESKINRAEKFEAISAVGEVLRDDVTQRFLTAPLAEVGGEVYGGEVWKELSESYLKSRPERQGGTIYIDTGELRDSLIQESNPDHIEDIDGDTFEFGTRLEKANKLQRLRAIVFWHPILLEKVAEVYIKYINGEIDKDGRIINR